MKTLIFIIALSFCSVSLAGPGHGHTHHDEAPAVSKEKTQDIGKTQIKRLIKLKKLDASWGKATYSKSEKKKFGKMTEWVVTFKNEKGIKGKNLFIFLNLSGGFIAANFTGK